MTESRWRRLAWRTWPWRSFALTAVAAAAFGVFLEIADEVLEAEHEDVDIAILRAFAGQRHDVLDRVIAAISWLGNFPVLLVVTLVACALLLRVDRAGAVQLGITAGVGGLLVRGAKALVARPRPEAIERLIDVTGHSFPSGHAMGATVVYLALALVVRRHLPRRWAVLVLVAAGLLVALIALSRTYLGVHYASDIAAGVAFGTAWVLAVGAVFSWRLHRVRQRDASRGSVTPRGSPPAPP